MNNIALIGMRGSGKNTIGTLLAQKLGKIFIDTDTRIIEKAGQTIPEIVSTHGWEVFRNYESAIAQEVGTHENAVIATGGGIVLREQNITALSKNAHIVLLTAPTTVLASRIADDPHRPPLTNHGSLHDELENVWHQRKDAYHSAADSIVTTENRTSSNIVAEILQNIGGTI